MHDRIAAYRFEDFIADTHRAADGMALFGLLSRAVGQYGYDRLIFSAPFDLDLPPEHNRRGLIQNYPDDWQAYYTENDCARIDPVLLAASLRTDAFTWDELEKTSDYSRAQIRFMRLAEDAGLHHGVGVPLHAGRSLIAGVGLASSHAIDATRPHLDLLNAYCTQFYMAYKRLYARPDISPMDTPLSAKEKEILHWVAAGKTDDDIGVILTISRNTVDTHMRHIFAKLDAPNRVTAVVKAIMGGHIRP
jgi:DNA-binding CsgD family transcriptional regulator